jgi:ssDNA-binding replication factor A large subunit
VDIEKGRPKNNGDPTWQACIRVKNERGREITVRGPARTDEDLAEDDGDAFRDAFKGGGYEGVRKLQHELNEPRRK